MSAAALAARAAEMYLELLSAARDPDPAVLSDALLRVTTELADDSPLAAQVLTLLVRTAHHTAESWCEDYGGDWPATVVRLRERMLS